MAEFTKVEFIGIMKKIQQIEELQSSIYSLCREVDPDTDVGFYPTLETALIDTLIKMYDDEENDWICWWLYETWFGTDHPEITDPSGKTYLIDTPGKLYHVLKEEWDKIE